MRFRAVFLSLLFAFPLLLFSVSEKPVVAVAAFSGALSGAELASLRGSFEYELVRTGAFTVLERGRVDAVLAEHEYALSGAVDPKYALELGLQLGARFVVTGEVTAAGGKLTLVVKMIDLVLGTIEKAEHAEGTAFEALAASCRRCAFALAGLPEPKAVAARPPEGFVSIPGGTFRMGSPEGEIDRAADEGPAREVRVSPFFMGKYEVTVAAFAEFVRATGYLTLAERDGGGMVYDGKEWVKKPEITWMTPGYAKGELDPVTEVAWIDCVEYCNWLSRRDGLKPAYVVAGSAVVCDFSADGWRLPTEAEWEYACRAGTTTPWWTGTALDPKAANCAEGGIRKPCAVGSFAPNAFGLHDTHGNVWEWCWDWYGPYDAAATFDPRGAPTGGSRICRGGAWDSRITLARSANRNYVAPDRRRPSIGFRIVRRP